MRKRNDGSSTKVTSIQVVRKLYRLKQGPILVFTGKYTSSKIHETLDVWIQKEGK